MTLLSSLSRFAYEEQYMDWPLILSYCIKSVWQYFSVFYFQNVCSENTEFVSVLNGETDWYLKFFVREVGYSVIYVSENNQQFRRSEGYWNWRLKKVSNTEISVELINVNF